MSIRFLRVAASLAFLFLAPHPTLASGQETGDANQWSFKVAPYFIFPNMNGSATIGGITADVDASPGDVFDKLQFGAMLFFEAATPKFAFTLDGLYMNLGQKGQTPITGRETEADMKQFAAQANFLWRLAPWAEIGLGGRLNTIEGGLKVAEGEVLPGRDVSQTKTWVDPLIAVRLTAPLESKWHLGIMGDYGGFGIGSDYAWQVFPFVGYRFSQLFELGAGYRAIGMKYETGSGDDLFIYDMTIFGPQIGLVFHF
jgi:hypothetical protein